MFIDFMNNAENNSLIRKEWLDKCMDNTEKKIVQINKDIQCKQIKHIRFVDEHCDSYLDIVFTDGSYVRVCYDWIYDMEFKQ